jgi:hypothetical protein
MKLFSKIMARFQAPPVPVIAPPDSDAEFLDVVMRQARERTRAEEAARKAIATKAPPDQLPAAA